MSVPIKNLRGEVTFSLFPYFLFLKTYFNFSYSVSPSLSLLTYKRSNKLFICNVQYFFCAQVVGVAVMINKKSFGDVPASVFTRIDEKVRTWRLSHFRVGLAVVKTQLRCSLFCKCCCHSFALLRFSHFQQNHIT